MPSRSWILRCVCVFAAVAPLAMSGRAAAAPPDIVLYATDATNIHGNWALHADSTAAGGQSIAGADNGWSATTNALAAPPAPQSA